MDKRTNTRLEFKIGVEIKVGTYQGFSVETRDLSLGGMQLVSENRLPKDTVCDITLHPLAGHNMAPFSLKATVVRHTDIGMGFAFLHVSQDSLLKLCDLFIAAGREDIIEKELNQQIPKTQQNQDILMM